MSPLAIQPEPQFSAPLLALLDEHLAQMRALSPPESMHALDARALQAADVQMFTAWRDGALLGCGALKALPARHAEIKSMRTAAHARGQGVASALLAHLLAVAQAQGHARVSLETGSQPAFEPARRLYARAGFVPCDPFGGYRQDPLSVFLTRRAG